MKPEAVFDIDLHDYSVRLLLPEDAATLQRLFEKCRDYFLVVDGQEPPPNAAKEEFSSVPPGKSLNDKFMFGIFHIRENLVGLLEGLRQYPDETTWWIGLFLLTPEARNQGIGQMVIHEFKNYVRRNGGQAIALGVVEDNQRAFAFWKKLGFAFLHKTEPRQFGNKMQTVSVMRQAL
jgi:ribosomal protein S18 acetylase RimI-like enzyme